MDQQRWKAIEAIYIGALDASDRDEVWGSIGVSENIIEASWEALVDSLEYGMQAGRRQARGETAAAGS